MSGQPSRTGPKPHDPHFLPWLQYGWDRAQPVLVLGLVPALATLLDFGTVARALLRPGGAHVGVSLSFPAPIADLWTFADLGVAGGTLAAPSLLVLALLVVTEGVLAAGYLGSIDDHLAGRRVDFGANLTAYAGRMVVYHALWLLLTVGVALLLASLSVALLLVVGLPAILLGSYLLYGTPYLLVLRDEPLGRAIGRSVAYARDGGAYARYGLGYLGGVALASLFVSAVVANFGPLGLLLGVAAAGTFGLALNVATMAVVRDLEAGRFRGASGGFGGPGDDPDEYVGGRGRDAGGTDDDRRGWEPGPDGGRHDREDRDAGQNEDPWASNAGDRGG
jgi:hypothetical protein